MIGVRGVNQARLSLNRQKAIIDAGTIREYTVGMDGPPIFVYTDTVVMQTRDTRQHSVVILLQVSI
jgi:hypothetical protein